MHASASENAVGFPNASGSRPQMSWAARASSVLPTRPESQTFTRSAARVSIDARNAIARLTSFEYTSGVRERCARWSSASRSRSSAVRHAPRPSR